MTRWTRNDSGQDLAEYAIVFFLLFLLILGIIEFAIIIFTQSSMSNVAREGARWAVVRRQSPNPSTYLPAVGSPVDQLCSGGGLNAIVVSACAKALALDPTKIRVIVSRPSTDQIRVQVRYSYIPFFGLINPFLPSGLTLGSQATMRLE